MTHRGRSGRLATGPGLWLILIALSEKSTSKHLFRCFRLSQIENSIQNLEGPNGILKNHDGHLGVETDPEMPIMVLPDTIWSFQVLNRVLYL